MMSSSTVRGERKALVALVMMETTDEAFEGETKVLGEGGGTSDQNELFLGNDLQRALAIVASREREKEGVNDLSTENKEDQASDGRMIVVKRNPLHCGTVAPSPGGLLSVPDVLPRPSRSAYQQRVLSSFDGDELDLRGPPDG